MAFNPAAMNAMAMLSGVQQSSRAFNMQRAEQQTKLMERKAKDLKEELRVMGEMFGKESMQYKIKAAQYYGFLSGERVEIPEQQLDVSRMTMQPRAGSMMIGGQMVPGANTVTPGSTTPEGVADPRVAGLGAAREPGYVPSGDPKLRMATLRRVAKGQVDQAQSLEKAMAKEKELAEKRYDDMIKGDYNSALQQFKTLYGLARAQSIGAERYPENFDTNLLLLRGFKFTEPVRKDLRNLARSLIVDHHRDLESMGFNLELFTKAEDDPLLTKEEAGGFFKYHYGLQNNNDAIPDELLNSMLDESKGELW